MQELVSNTIADSIAVKQAVLNDPVLIDKTVQVIKLWSDAFRSGGKVLFCGNGGSAADAQHLAAELSGRFYKNRAPLFAEALHVNTSYLTAVANDFGYEQVYARMVEAAGRPGDVLVAMSTSGNSANILAAVEQARMLKMKVVGFTGQGGGRMADQCDVLLNVPSGDTPRIQEVHMLIGHIICEQVEAQLFP